jgi:hypothetical protein
VLVVGIVGGAWLAIVVVCVLAVTLLGSNAEEQFTVIDPGSELPPADDDGAGTVPWTQWAELDVGDCLAADAGSTVPLQTHEVAPISCDEPHRTEVFFVQPLPDLEFPGESRMQDLVDLACTGQAFTDYVGVPYEETTLWISWSHPGSTSWAEGDRTFACFVHGADPAMPTTGSFRDSGL